MPDHDESDPLHQRTSRRRLLGYVVAWLVAAGLAVTVGLVAVTSVGASIRGRGPLGNEAIRNAELAGDDGTGVATPDPGVQVVRREIDEEYGTFVVECRGTTATGVETRTSDGWQVVSFDSGPDDDVDAVFVSGQRSIEVEVFCNRGTPTVSEIERKTLPQG